MARTIIVTGGFGVLGHAVAERFLAAGDRVVRIDFAPAPSVALDGAHDIGGIDLTNVEATRGALDTLLADGKRLDVLINVAGGFTWQTLADGDLAAWTRMFEINLLSAATITKLALAALLASPAGRVISIGAGAAVKAGAGMGAYAASKSGVHRLIEALAEELAGTSVTANALLPSIVDTPTNRRDMPDADVAQWVSPAAIADVALFLASDAARAITGALIPVTRGTGSAT